MTKQTDTPFEEIVANFPKSPGPVASRFAARVVEGFEAASGAAFATTIQDDAGRGLIVTARTPDLAARFFVSYADIGTARENPLTDAVASVNATLGAAVEDPSKIAPRVGEI